jgi:hypothetical protein
MNDLMTIEDIAAMWKVKRDHAQRYLVKRPEFPAPVPGSTRKQRRWRRGDVEAFAKIPA